MTKRVGIVVFPGSNCDQDCARAVSLVGAEPVMLWHKDRGLSDVDSVVLPGGFSYGDYLRCGSIAKFSPIMEDVIEFANKGKPVLGICNGFQVLCESGLLPGVLMRNKSLHFICETLPVQLVSQKSQFVNQGQKDQAYQIPIAHMEGNYFIENDGLKSLQDNDQIVFRYQNNPNGAIDDIAGICNKAGNVLGMMPHPERVCEDMLGGTDGRFIFESLMD